MLEQITTDIFRLKVPFADIYTTVFVAVTPAGTVLFDAAAKDSDVDTYIVPALKRLGVRPDYVFISHNHGDHSGGLERVMELYPAAKVVTSSKKLQHNYGKRVLCPEEKPFLQVLQPVFIPGHTADAVGLLDTRTATLLSGDCLQAYGIFGAGPWGTAIRHIGPHLQAIEKLRTMEIQMLATAHDYHPFEAVVRGTEVSRFLDTCIEALGRIRNMVLTNPDLEDEQLACLCNDGSLPRIDHGVVAGMRIAIEAGAF